MALFRQRPERPIKETTRDIVVAMQKRGLLQCNTFGFQSRETDDPDSSLPDLFKEYSESVESPVASVFPILTDFRSLGTAVKRVDKSMQLVYP
jgi:hypothetical protein